jgi:hypothetical protein
MIAHSACFANPADNRVFMAGPAAEVFTGEWPMSD